MTQRTEAEIIADETPFALETLVIARGRDYSFEGHIVAVFRKYGLTQRLDGPLRYVVEDSRGLLLIHSPRTLRVARSIGTAREEAMSAGGDDEIVEAMAKEIYRCSPLTVEGVAVDWDSETAILHPTLREQSEVEARAALATARPLIERAARAVADAEIADVKAKMKSKMSEAFAVARPIIEQTARASADAEIADLRARLAKAEEALERMRPEASERVK